MSLLLLPLPSSVLPMLASALLAQVGPFAGAADHSMDLPARTTAPVSRHVAKPPPAAVVTREDPVRLRECLAAADDEPEDGEDTATAWLARAKGNDAAQAGLCLGVARSRNDDWTGAEQAFVAAVEQAGSDRLLRARLGAMAGNAALAAGAPERALAALDPARGEAKALADTALIAPIALDRARALVALNRLIEASAALSEARSADPVDAEAWLLSATLARRQGRLAEAQVLIERAAELRPIEPAIGLEAGVIAMLAGRPEAARRSWQSVVTMAPDSEAGSTAQRYLAQLPAAVPAPTKKKAGPAPKP